MAMYKNSSRDGKRTYYAAEIDLKKKTQALQMVEHLTSKEPEQVGYLEKQNELETEKMYDSFQQMDSDQAAALDEWQAGTGAAELEANSIRAIIESMNRDEISEAPVHSYEQWKMLPQEERERRIRDTMVRQGDIGSKLQSGRDLMNERKKRVNKKFKK